MRVPGGETWRSHRAYLEGADVAVITDHRPLVETARQNWRANALSSLSWIPDDCPLPNSEVYVSVLSRLFALVLHRADACT